MSDRTEPTWLSRVLSPFTEVHPGEAVTALAMTANVFLLLTSYYVMKPVREGLILALDSGAEYKAAMSAVIAVLLIGLVPLYAKLVDRLPRIKLVIGVTLAFAAQLLLFIVAMKIPSLYSRLGLVFYAWVGVFNVMVVAQFWSYANDLYDKAKGKRLFPMIALGGMLGAVLGSALSAVLSKKLGLSTMLLLAALLLVACSALFWIVERREAGEKNAARTSAPSAAEPDASPSAAQTVKSGPFELIRTHRYLLLLALFSLVFSCVNTNGEYMLGKLFKAGAAAAVQRGELANDPEAISEYLSSQSGAMFFYVNALGLALQSFLVSRLVKWLGLPKAFLLMPVLSFGSNVAIAILPVLAMVRAGKVAENATDYSLNNTLRQMLWLVTSAEMKYKAKQAIDTFCVRMGDVLSFGMVWLLVSFLALPLQVFAGVNAALAALWLVLALAIGRSHKKLEESSTKVGA